LILFSGLYGLDVQHCEAKKATEDKTILRGKVSSYLIFYSLREKVCSNIKS